MRDHFIKNIKEFFKKDVCLYCGEELKNWRLYFKDDKHYVLGYCKHCRRETIIPIDFMISCVDSVKNLDGCFSNVEKF